MTSPMTAPIIAAQRASNRWKTYHLAVSQPSTVFTCKINQTFGEGLNNISVLTYDTGTGTYTDVKAGMTAKITSSGALVGIARIRKTPTDTLLYISRTSGISFADNQDITIYSDWRVWPRVAQQSAGATSAVDDDIEFSAVTALAPVVRIGPPAVVLEMTGASINFEPTASVSLATGRTASSYLWAFPGSSALSGETTATPTATYDTDGEYYYSCTVTDSAGGVTTVYRKAFVNPSETAKFSLSEISGDVDSGGWSAQVEGLSGVDTSSIDDGTLVVLWKRDYLGAARDTSYGPYAGFENERLIGWVDGDTISVNPQFGTYSFRINGPAEWMKKTSGTPMTLTSTGTTSTAWDSIEDMTTASALRRLLFNSTISEITDITLPTDVTPISTATINTGSIYEQMDGLIQEKLLGRLYFDRFGCGRFVIPINLQATPRSIDDLFTVADSDWSLFDQGERIVNTPSAQLTVAGVAWDGSEDLEYWSRAPGDTPLPRGAISSPYSSLAVTSQSDINRLSGDILASDNKEWPSVEIEFTWCNDYLDIAPLYTLLASLASSKSPRGITWTNKSLCPLSMVYNYDPETGAEYTSCTLEVETSGVDGITYIPPDPYIETPPIVVPPIPPTPPVGNPEFPPSSPPVNCNFATTLTWTRTNLSGTMTPPRNAYAWVTSTLRSAAQGGSKVEMNAFFNYNVRDKIHMYAINSAKTRLVTGQLDLSFGIGFQGLRFWFKPAAETAIAGFEIVVDEQFNGYVAGTPISSGEVNGTDTGILISDALTIGQAYCVDGTGGPWLYQTIIPTALFYNFAIGDGTNWSESVDYGGMGYTPTYSSGAGGMSLALATWATNPWTVALDGIYARAFFTATATDLYFRVSDSLYGDNGGTLGYILRNATGTLINPTIQIGNTYAYYLCGDP